MSIELIDFTLNSTLPPTTKLVLVVLAYAANANHECWPSMQYVAKRSSLSKRTAQRITQELIACGHLESFAQYRDDRSQRSNLFKLYIPAKSEKAVLTPPPASTVAEGVNTVALEGDTDVTLTTTEPSYESFNNHNKKQLFFPDQFTDAEKNAALTLVSALSDDIAQQLLDEVAARMRRNEIRKSPISYLRGLAARAKQGEFVPEIGECEAQLRLQKSIRQAKPQPKLTVRNDAQKYIDELKKLIK